MKNPFSLDAFRDWCAKQPAGQRYDYCDVKQCACAQYARFLGLESQSDFPETFWKAAEKAAFGPVGMDWTFGALTKRLVSVPAESA